MNIEDIENEIQALLMARVDALGVGVSFMEPYVFLSKVRRERLPGRREKFAWQNTDIMITAWAKTERGAVCTVFEPDGKTIIATFTQTC